MGIAIFSNSNQRAYGIKHFVVDSVDEINTLQTNCSPGSTAFVVETSTTYMLNTAKQWKEVALSHKCSCENDDTSSVIYDGGSPV